MKGCVSMVNVRKMFCCLMVIIAVTSSVLTGCGTNSSNTTASQTNQTVKEANDKNNAKDVIRKPQTPDKEKALGSLGIFLDKVNWDNAKISRGEGLFFNVKPETKISFPFDVLVMEATINNTPPKLKNASTGAVGNGKITRLEVFTIKYLDEKQTLAQANSLLSIYLVGDIELEGKSPKECGLNYLNLPDCKVCFANETIADISSSDWYFFGYKDSFTTTEKPFSIINGSSIEKANVIVTDSDYYGMSFFSAKDVNNAIDFYKKLITGKLSS